ncbi:CPBP family intramembrane glutamic endopeptidase [Arthrobacter sp. TMP15]|uniref:CPBP family intramembrane glutamic endopeptidase n=1 Tax=Arthrobacter sp. TMP15 TaxID=3140789 RepID=UPI0031BA43BF
MGVPALLLAGVTLLPGTLSSFTVNGLSSVLLTYPLQLLGIILLGGGLEEMGWRGFAQPKLQEKYSPLMAALLIGVLWAGWHAPLFLTQIWDTPRNSIFQVFLYVLVVAALSVVMSWIRNGSQSTLAAIVAHASVNGSLGVLAIAFPGSFVEVSNWWGLGIVLGAAAVALITRGRLGLVQQKLGLAL